MTAMPEAALAREAGLAYAVCAGVVNRAAGRLPPGGTIHGDLAAHVDRVMGGVTRLLERFLAAP
jgi:purine nucleoside phosphorylase